MLPIETAACSIFSEYTAGLPAGFTGPHRGRKCSLHDRGIRMPGVARRTATVPTEIEDTFSVMSAPDGSATICRFAEVSADDNLDRQNWSNIFPGRAAKKHKERTSSELTRPAVAATVCNDCVKESVNT